MRKSLPHRILRAVAPSTRTLRATLAIYFFPIAILPVVFISYYATRTFERSAKDTIIQTARIEKDSFIESLQQLEKDILNDARAHAKRRDIRLAVGNKDNSSLNRITRAMRDGLQVRVFSLSGKHLYSRNAQSAPAYISQGGLKEVKRRGSSFDRYFSAEGIRFVSRILIQSPYQVYGILEEEYVFGTADLKRVKEARQIDIVLVDTDMTAVAGSFALSPDIVKSITQEEFRSTIQGAEEPSYLNLGDDRFASFLFTLPSGSKKDKPFGNFALFLSMTTTDAIISKLKFAMISISALLVLTATLLIFMVSRSLVRPIETLVFAMKRMKTGRTEQIQAMDSAYEVEYLIRSYNEMARNISGTKRTLEERLIELHKANKEIKDTQDTLIQSAKMISLGELVAGVAHELNNPIGFIYSNMNHLKEYANKLQTIIHEYQAQKGSLPEEERKRIEALERDLEIEYILTDMVELTESCLDGANRTKEIVMGLRTFSRMDEANFKPSDLHEGLRSTIRLVASDYKDRVSIHEQYGELPLVECSISQLNQVFMNLISNGAQAIGKTGDIWVRTRTQDNFVVIEIEDNGRGMPSAVQKKIFDPFFTTKQVGEGTGLGLSIAYGLIQKHGGQISVSSKEGRGTKFTILLPIRQSLGGAATA